MLKDTVNTIDPPKPGEHCAVCGTLCSVVDLRDAASTSSSDGGEDEIQTLAGGIRLREKLTARAGVNDKGVQVCIDICVDICCRHMYRHVYIETCIVSTIVPVYRREATWSSCRAEGCGLPMTVAGWRQGELYLHAAITQHEGGMGGVVSITVHRADGLAAMDRGVRGQAGAPIFFHRNLGSMPVANATEFEPIRKGVEDTVVGQERAPSHPPAIVAPRRHHTVLWRE